MIIVVLSVLIAVHDGAIKIGDIITLAQSGRDYEVLEIGLMYPSETQWKPCMQVKWAMLLRA